MSLMDALRSAGFTPDDNICARCGHHGGDHDLGNWCLVCPRPEMPARPIERRLAAGWCYFSSMTKDEQWAWGIGALRAAGVVDRTTHEKTAEALVLALESEKRLRTALEALVDMHEGTPYYRTANGVRMEMMPRLRRIVSAAWWGR